MKQLAFLVLSALAGVSPQAAMAQGGDAQEFLARGLQFAYQGDTASAVAELSNAVKANPKLADAYYYLGRLYSRRASAVETDFFDRPISRPASGVICCFKRSHPSSKM